MAESLPGALLSAFTSGAVGAGLSAREALAEVRSVGWAVSNERWFRAFRDATTARDLAGSFTDLDALTVIPPELHAPWRVANPEGYVYRANVSTIEPETGVRGYVSQMVFSDVPLSPADVSQQIWDEWTDPENTGLYDLTATRVDVVAAYAQIGYDDPESGPAF